MLDQNNTYPLPRKNLSYKCCHDADDGEDDFFDGEHV
jgi:hypothetical protein